MQGEFVKLVKVVYVAQLGGHTHTENIVLEANGLATLYRYGRPLVRFVPSQAQLRKIKTFSGNVSITDEQIRRASIYGNQVDRSIFGSGY
jgi:hypothetical protein